MIAQGKRDELNEQYSRYFDTINTIPLKTVVTFLNTESPLQAVLVIVALEPEKAIFVLEHIPEQVRRSIITVLAQGIQLSSNVYEAIIAQAVDTLQNMQRLTSVDFMDEFEDMIPLLRNRTVRYISALLKEKDPGRYHELYSSLLTLDDILLLHDNAVIRMLWDEDIIMEELAAALIGAPDPLIEKIKGGLSKSGIMDLKKLMKMQDTLPRLIDPEKVQDIIAGVMRKLAKAGDISIRESDEFIF